MILENLRKAQQIAHIGSWEWDLLSNKFTVSEELYRIYGFNPDDTIEYETLLARTHPDDFESAAQQAHKIKGAAGNVGSDALKEVAYQIEKSGQDQDMARLETLLPMLEQKFTQLEQAMKEI